MEKSHEAQFNETKDVKIDARGYTDAITRATKCKLGSICDRINRSHSYFTSFRNNGFMHRKDIGLLEKLYGIPAAPYFKNITDANEHQHDMRIELEDNTSTVYPDPDERTDIIWMLSAIAKVLPNNVTITINGGEI